MKKTIAVSVLTLAGLFAGAVPALGAPAAADAATGGALTATPPAAESTPTLPAWEDAPPALPEPTVVRNDPPPPLPAPKRVYSEDVERWRPLVSSYFAPDDIAWAMRVMNCESRGDPLARNPRSSASGLFQHLLRYWAERAAKAGWAGSSVFDPTANVAVAAWLFYDGGGPSHWTCR